jgi:hypothetical protein
MPEFDFVMTYPYFLLAKRSNPETVIVDENLCLCLFTDIHLVDQFYHDKHGNDGFTLGMETCTMPDCATLKQILRECPSELAQQGCTSIAIDASRHRIVGYFSMEDFIGEVSEKSRAPKLAASSLAYRSLVLLSPR